MVSPSESPILSIFSHTRSENMILDEFLCSFNSIGENIPTTLTAFYRKFFDFNFKVHVAQNEAYYRNAEVTRHLLDAVLHKIVKIAFTNAVEHKIIDEPVIDASFPTEFINKPIHIKSFGLMSEIGYSFPIRFKFENTGLQDYLASIYLANHLVSLCSGKAGTFPMIRSLRKVLKNLPQTVDILRITFGLLTESSLTSALQRNILRAVVKYTRKLASTKRPDLKQSLQPLFLEMIYESRLGSTLCDILISAFDNDTIDLRFSIESESSFRLPYLLSAVAYFIRNSSTLFGLHLPKLNLSRSISYIGGFYDKCASLELLDLSNTNIGPESMHVLGFLFMRAKKLSYLDLSYCSLGSTGVKAFCRWVRFMPLASLDLSGNDISNDGLAQLLEKAVYFGVLNKLILTSNKISTRGMRLFFDAKGKSTNSLPNLTELDFSHNEIADSGLRILSAVLQDWKKLSKLYLDDNCITDNGVICLSEALTTSLRYISLLDNSITHKAFGLLYKATNEYPLLNIILPAGSSLSSRKSSIHPDDPISLDEYSHRPVLLTFIEILPKEKKQKEERSIVLGQVTFGLVEILQGQLKISQCLPISPVPGSPLDNLPADAAKPEVDILISAEDKILNDNLLCTSNFCSLTVESLYSSPETWTTSGQHYIYAAGTPMPLTKEKTQPLVFTGGSLLDAIQPSVQKKAKLAKGKNKREQGSIRPAVDKEPPSKQKKWAAPGKAVGSAVFVPNQVVEPVCFDDETGELRSKEDRLFRQTADLEKNKVVWNTTRSCYMDPTALTLFRERISRCRYWPIEIMRTLPAEKGKKGTKEDEFPVFYHGVAYVNMAPLLYPGATKIRGAFPVHPFYESEVLNKTENKGSLANDIIRVIFGGAARNQTPVGKKGKDKDAGKDKDKKFSVALKPGAALPSIPAEEPQNIEGMAYIEARSYVMLEIKLLNPLVRKRTPEELSQRVANYIPPRPRFPKRTGGAEQAVSDYHCQIASIAKMVLDEYRRIYCEQQDAGSAEDADGRRKQVMYSLNSSGRYFAFKEQLKYAIVKIVREKFFKTKPFEESDEFQAFLQELYVYLVDQMHVALKQTVSIQDQPEIPDPVSDIEQLKQFAIEATYNGDFQLAHKYYQERIARTKRADCNCWIDYGLFSLYITDICKAEECFRECVAMDQCHFDGLLLSGITSALQEKFDGAETFFETAVNIQPECIVAWTLFGMFYESTNDDINQEMAIGQAEKINRAHIKQQLDAEYAAMLAETEAAAEAAAAIGEAAPGDIVTHTHQPRQSFAQTQPILTPNTGTSDPSKGAKLTRSATKHSIVPQAGGAQTKKTGKTSAMGKETKEESVEPPRPSTPVPNDTIYLQTARWLIDRKCAAYAQRALAHHLDSPYGGVCLEYQLLLAKAKLLASDFVQAEAALSLCIEGKAPSLDPSVSHQNILENADIFALLGHCRYYLLDFDAARLHYERTLDLVSEPEESHPVYLRLGSIYLESGHYEHAKRTFLLACKRNPTSITWLGVGISCYRQGNLVEAEEALSMANILNNHDPEVWAYLSLICLSTSRKLEAEQAYKYAVKLNLQKPGLLEEIHKMQQDAGFGNPTLTT